MTMPLPHDLPADRYHLGVRLSLVAWFVFSLVMVVAVVGGLAQMVVGGWGWLAGYAAALLSAQPLSRWAEKYLLARWPSGRVVRLQAGLLNLHTKEATHSVALGADTRFARWYFVVRGRSSGRVPNGHVCLALRCADDQQAVSIYAFMPPKQAEAVRAGYPFYELRRMNEKGTVTLGGRDPAFLAAEQERWNIGAELDAADFAALLEALNADWPGFAATALKG